MEGRLTQLEYWQAIHKEHPPAERAASGPGIVGRISRYVTGGNVGSHGYAAYHFWHLVARFLPKGKGARALEIGAAPGAELVKLSSRFGCVPYGVEYTSTGADQVRTALKQIGYSPENVFECDAFSDDFQHTHRNEFDVVMSLGFIEHFEDVQKVVQHHIDLLAPGGTLIIRIPRLRGLNYLLARAIDPSCLPIHNLTIMTRKRFKALFQMSGLTPLYCDYQGAAHFTLADEPRGRLFGRAVLFIARKAQAVANMAMYRIFGTSPIESAAFSPFLLYVGRKN